MIDDFLPQCPHNSVDKTSKHYFNSPFNKFAEVIYEIY